MIDKMNEIKKALVSLDEFTIPDGRGLLGNALSILNEIQNEQAVDVDAIRKEFIKSFRGPTKGTLCPDVSRRIKRGISHLAIKGLLRGVKG